MRTMATRETDSAQWSLGAVPTGFSLAQLDEPSLRALAETLRPYLLVGGTDPACALLTPQEAARRAGVHTETIRRAARSGALPASRAGRAVRIAQADLDAWLSGATRAERTRAPRRRQSASRQPLANALAGTDTGRAQA